jgi:CheY-like chemotaxis protein
VLSGSEDAEVADRCLRNGADRYERKGGFAPSELRQIVFRAIGRER